VLPGDRDGDVNAKYPGEDRGGQVGGELEQCGGAGLAGVEAELAESLGELVGADGAAGLAAGEQPGRSSVLADGGLAAAAGDDVAGERGERSGSRMGSSPSRMRTSLCVMSMWSTVRRLIAAGPWT
jgi:hypothetical protein